MLGKNIRCIIKELCASEISAPQHKDVSFTCRNYADLFLQRFKTNTHINPNDDLSKLTLWALYLCVSHFFTSLLKYYEYMTFR